MTILAGTYPKSWDEVIGQEKAKRQLQVAIRAAQMRGVPMPHTLLASGVPGVGKTALAVLCAQELGTGVKIVSGRMKGAEARLVLADMCDGDALIIEEVHQLAQVSKKDAEWLLHLMENGVLIGPRGPEPQPAITIVATTTDPGRLPEPVLERFTCKPALTPYSDDEATQIAQLMAMRLFDPPMCLPTKGNCAAVAQAANNNPRQVRILLENLRDHALVEGPDFWDLEDGYPLDQVLDDHGLTADGLTQTAQRYLRILHDEWAGEPAGVSAMKERLREPGGLDYTERLLQEKGFIALTKRGRLLTQSGIRRARALAEAHCDTQ